MNRKDFMAKLEQLLRSIPAEERREALQYYEYYFDDAGAEHEEEVIQELGSPEKVAAMIGADLKPGSEENGEFTEHGFTDERFEEKETPAMRGDHTKRGDRYSFHQEENQNRGYSGSYGYENGASRQAKPRTSKTLKVLLIVAIILVVSPVAVPVILGVAAVVFGLVVAAFVMFAAFVIAAVAVAVSGIAVVIAGMIASIGLPSALMTVGIGLLMFTFGAIATVATVKLCMVMYPAMVRIIVNICRIPFHGRKAVV